MSCPEDFIADYLRHCKTIMAPTKYYIVDWVQNCLLFGSAFSGSDKNAACDVPLKLNLNEFFLN